MNKLLTIAILLTGFISCTPELNTLKQADCGDGYYFDEVRRSCTLDASPKAPVITSTSFTIAEDSPKTSFPITYTDSNSNIVNSCTIVDTGVGIRGKLEVGSMTFEKVNTWANEQAYPSLYIEMINNNLISAGSETVSITGNTITIEIDSGFSTSLNITNAINADITISGLITASVTGGNQAEAIFPSQKLLGADCECIAGVCSIEVEPSRHISGSSFVDLYVTDVDGDSLINRLSLTITPVDQAPTIVSTRTATALEDDVITYSFASELVESPIAGYFDYDGDFATMCVATSVHPNVQANNISCTCSLGTCTLSVQADTDYFNVGQEDLVNYQIYTNGQPSNTGTASAHIIEVDDQPVAANIFTITVDEDDTGLASTFANFTFPTATDDSYMGFLASNMRYKLSNLSSFPGVFINSCTGVPGDVVFSNNATDLVNCLLEIDGDVNGSFTLEYVIADTSPVTSMSEFHGTGYINLVINAKNDPPVVSGGPFTEAITESTDWTTSTSTFTIGNVVDVDDTNATLAVYFIDASNNRINTMAGQSTLEGKDGTIGNCVIDTSGNISCDYTPLTGNTANSSGTPDSFTFVVQDSSTAESLVQNLDITINETSDAPVLCNYSVYDARKSRIECGVNGCMGEGAPDFDPTSHLADDPVVYFDRKDSICYESLSTSSWAIASNGGSQIASYISNVVIGEKEEVIIDNIVITEGGSIAEAGQDLFITNISSTNSVLFKPENIYFLKDTDNDGVYDLSVQNTGPTAIDSAGTPSINEKFRIRMVPTSGLFGTSTISFDLEDDTGQKNTFTFDVRVEPQTITHNGWDDIKALGVKVDHFRKKLDDNFVCSQSLTKCDNGQECYGSSTPIGSVIPDAPGAIYRSSTNECYYSTGTNNTDWTLITKKVSCNVSETNRTYTHLDLLEDDPTNSFTKCSDLGSASCIGEVNVLTPSSIDLEFMGNTETLLASENIGAFILNLKNNPTTEEDCFYSDGTNWVGYHGTSTVSLEWEAFTVNTSASILGYNIYRKKAGAINDFNYNMPLNRSVVTGTSYVDNGENSRLAPVPKQAYIYEVRPVLSYTNLNGDPEELEVTTNNKVAKVRLISPQENFAFVHQWMVNKKACEMMHSTVKIDSDYSCDYSGYGDTTSTLGGTLNSIYDFGKDLLVPRFEMGCPYTKSGCNTADGQCIAQNRTTTLTASLGSIFYERSTGQCLVRTGGWSSYSGTALSNDAFSAHLPPLTNISASNSATSCVSMPDPAIVGYTGGTSARLPTRAEQIAYSAWDVRSTSESSIENLERGLALNSAGKCNSSFASGVDASFMDTDTLSSSDVHAISGTFSSNIRSLHTGSEYTNECSSMFGIQDAVGNVAEYSSTSFTLASNKLSFSSIDDDSTSNTIDQPSYIMGGLTGPCEGYDDVGDTCSSVFSTAVGNPWLFEDVSSYQTKYFNYVFGIPLTNIYEDAVDTAMTDDLAYILRIGSTAGITNSQLHDDGMFIESTITGPGLMVSGGDYTRLNASGVYAMELVNNTDTSERIGLRCVIQIDSSSYEAE